MSWLRPDLHDVMVAFVVREWHRLTQEPSQRLGKTKLQKLVYFSKVAGVPLPFDFEIYYYGPYSQDVAEEVDRLEVLGLVEGVRDTEGAVHYRPGNKLEETVSRFMGGLESYTSKIQRAIKVFGNMPAKVLELHATVHFVRRSGGRMRTVEETIEAVRSLKGNRFSEEEIRSAIEYLESNGFP